MAQVSWRADDRLVERVKLAAVNGGQSMNEFITLVLDAATDPAHADSEAQQVRERLQRAGLLATPPRTATRRPPRAAIAAASARAASGSALADLVSEGR